MYTGYGAGLANKRSLVHVLAVPLSGNNLRPVVHTLVPLSPSSKSGTSQRTVTPCGWEGNCRSGVALAMRHRLQWFIHLRTHGLRKGDEHLPTLLTGYGTLYLYLAATAASRPQSLTSPCVALL